MGEIIANETIDKGFTCKICEQLIPEKETTQLKTGKIKKEKMDKIHKQSFIQRRYAEC